MNENLSDLVKTETDDPIVFSESDLDLPESATAETEAPTLITDLEFPLQLS